MKSGEKHKRIELPHYYYSVVIWCYLLHLNKDVFVNTTMSRMVRPQISQSQKIESVIALYFVNKNLNHPT